MKPLLLGIMLFAVATRLSSAEPASSAQETDQSNPWAGCIQTLPLESKHPYFLPANPRVTLTVRFPDQILDVDGAGFTTNEGLVPGEYRISWREGDDYFSITQLPGASMRNLNVIVAGQTVVLVLYPVESPLKAITSLTFTRKTQENNANNRRTTFRSTPAPAQGNGSPSQSGGSLPAATRLDTKPDSPFEKVGPARLIGMLDRLKLLHATKYDEMESVLAAMPSVSVADFGTIFDQGLVKVQLVRTVRDSRLDLVGFILIVRNVSKQEVVLDPESWAARVGLAYFPQATSDCQPKIPPGEAMPAYFVVAGDGNGRPGYMKADNEWRVSVGILAPKINPGGTLSAEFAKEIQ